MTGPDPPVAAAPAQLHLVDSGAPELTPPVIRSLWHGALILNASSPDPADHPRRLDLISAGVADLISFGRLFIANPDLVTRLQTGADLAQPDVSAAYGGDQRGYIDYPALEPAARAA
ncbi:MAG: hypothetical protein J2P23_00060 [Microlunatus sp.]|nr:hypothetical protein [Microlunatus sp.]